MREYVRNIVLSVFFDVTLLFPKTVLTARDKIYVKETNKEKNIKQESEI